MAAKSFLSNLSAGGFGSRLLKGQNMSIRFKKPYKFAHQGLLVEHFTAGQVVENPSQELAQTAAADGVLDMGESEEETKPEPKKSRPKA